ncbi:class I SAM-dependent methyltransferase [Luteimonas sp. MC1828]|uniref:methyltransferase domain-containing protein n=1 Tax=Luteimonas sp. MC1828 TaxID=2799787 RepID=UPI0018F25CA9|nr:methyltransferase domain-containing protein [Luteimonas sp. MC1828]
MSRERRIGAQYNAARGGGLTDRVSTHMRRKMYARFMAAGVADDDRILDVGVTSDRAQLASNYLEAWHPRKDLITACGIDDASFLEDVYPGMTFVRGDGKDLPFPDASFDWVHSSAVLEHVGSAQEQARFVAELHRVSRKGVFLTTPNRWFPVEFHTVLPVVHWLPKPWFRALLRRLGHRELSREENLNLLGRRELDDACAQARLPEWRIDSVALLGWPSNLLLVARRPQATLMAAPRGDGAHAG